MKKFLAFALICFYFSAVHTQKKYTEPDPFEMLVWICDNWVSPPGESITYENWNKINDTVYSGESHTVKNGETVFTEQLKIEKIGDDIFYTAVVKHNKGPVHFKLIEIEGNKAVFENKKHDYPNRIIYELKNDGSLYARIEGKNKKGEDVIGEFTFTRAR